MATFNPTSPLQVGSARSINKLCQILFRSNVGACRSFTHASEQGVGKLEGQRDHTVIIFRKSRDVTVEIYSRYMYDISR